MALKRKLTKEEFEKLTEDMKSHYIEKDGDYFLDVEGSDALLNAKLRESEDRKKAEAELVAAKKRLAEFEKNDALRSGDFEKLQAGWQAEKVELEKSFAEKEARLKSHIQKSFVDNVAHSLANDSTIFVNPHLMLPFIKERLSIDGIDTDDIKTVVLKDGKPSKMTIDELKKEFVDNPIFSTNIVGSKASGGGAANDGKQTQIGASGPNGLNERPDISKMKPAEVENYLKTKRS